MLENEKNEAQRTVEKLRMKNEELRLKYDQLLIGNDSRIDVNDHIREITESKRSFGKKMKTMRFFFLKTERNFRFRSTGRRAKQ